MIKLDRFPRYHLAHGLTPLEPMDRLGKALGGARLFVKRDDCTGLALGGNKVRKLEFLLGDALDHGASALVTVGGLQSNHVRQTAAAAAKAGLPCTLALAHGVALDDGYYTRSGNLLLDRLLGAEVQICGPGETREMRGQTIVEAMRGRGETPYLIPAGGSTPIGTLGYVDCALELAEQAARREITLDRVVVAASSGGTMAGLAIGLSALAPEAELLGISVDDDAAKVREDVVRLARDGATLLGLDPDAAASRVEVVDGFAAPGYGVPNDGMVEAVRLLARLEGLILDPVYTGKAMAGLIALARQGRIGAGEHTVFIHTGGAPGLFAYTPTFTRETSS